MGWPKHKYAWVIRGPHGGLLRDNGEGGFYEGGFGDVFTDKRVAAWLAGQERAICRRIASAYRDRPDQQAQWLGLADEVRILKVALPGSSPQPDYEALVNTNRRMRRKE